MRALALEHLHSNPVGVYGDVLDERGIDVDRVRLDLLEPLPDWRDYDLLVVMGGGMSVYQEDAYPWLIDEKRAIREAVMTGMPYFGVCLGSQLLASSLGARVYKGAEPELGVNPVFLCEPAQRDPVFRGFPFDLEVFEWHSDTFELPEGAVRLARSPRYENQAFRVGSVAYAIQCHMETTLDDVRDWFGAWPSLVEVFEGRYGAGSLDVFLDEYAASVPHLRRSARQLFGRWLENALATHQPAHRPRFAVAIEGDELLGRDDERARIARFLDAARDGRSGALLVGGDTGIGKTALLEDTVATASGMHVIRVAGVDSEVAVPCAGIEEMCRPLLRYLREVPEDHAEALAIALGLREGSQRGDRFAAYAGVLDLLAAAAGRRPLLVCVDDAHLLDETTLEALAFVAGRIEAEGVGLLVATGGEHLPGFETLELGPLDRDASLAMLERRFGDELSPHVAAEIIAVAGGNALALVEIPLSLSSGQRAGTEPVGDALKTRRTAEQALLERISSLSDRERRALFVPALARTDDLAVVGRALEILGLDPADLDAAVEDGFVSIEDDRIRFTHGLVRSTVAYGALRTERRETHASLARAVDASSAPDAAAWHRALSAPAPDENIAVALERSAARAASRRAHADAARAYDHAARLSPDASHRSRRLISAAEEADLAGHVHAAIEDLQSALPELDDPIERSHAERLLGRLLARTGSAARARDILLASAATAAEADPGGVAHALTDAVIPTLRGGDPVRACQIGRRAVELAEGTEPRSEIAATTALATALILSGTFAEGRDLALHASKLADGLDGDLRLRSYLGAALRLAGEYDLARDALVSVVAEARARGAAGVLAYALVRLGDVELDQGRWTMAAGTLTDASTLAIETGQAADRGLAAGALAWLAAVRGREHECRERAGEALQVAERLGEGSRVARAAQAVGLLELGLGRFDEAAAELSEISALKMQQGWSDAAVAPHWAPDLIEALVLAGRVDEARREVERFSSEAVRVRRASSLAALARCRGMLSAGDEATAAFEEALAVDVEATGSFERGRTQLVFGERLLPDDTDEARRRLTSALERFTRLAAAPWAARARQGLRRLGSLDDGGRPAPLARLNERELQVALAVADGQDLREAAAGLLLTVPTVEHNLDSALAKLGLDSPGGLATLLLSDAIM